MSRFRSLTMVLAASAVLTGASPSIGHAAAGRIVAAGWGNAIPVPGSLTLNEGGLAETSLLSCTSPGNCSAAGSYMDGSDRSQVFVVDERHGIWRTAAKLPGLTHLNVGGIGIVASLSCASPGNCAVGGSYETGSFASRPFVASQTNGTWHDTVEVRGPRSLNASRLAQIDSISCGAPGNCAAGGFYEPRPDHYQAFLVDERAGKWGKAFEVPGSAALNTGGDAEVGSISCASPGDCTAAGTYRRGSRYRYEEFAVTEKRGTWATAITVPGLNALNAGGFVSGGSVSCTSAGNCGVGGFYLDRSGHYQAFAVTESHGTWGKAKRLPTSGVDVNFENFSLSCTSAGNCAAGWSFANPSDHDQAFLAVEKDGRWDKAFTVRGLRTLNTGQNANIYSVSCASAGNCAAVGSYVDASKHTQGFVINESSDRWGKAVTAPGLMTLNAGGNAGVFTVSCASAGKCAAGGSYLDGSGNAQAFVITQT